jgi:hypothetical protein
MDEKIASRITGGNAICDGNVLHKDPLPPQTGMIRAEREGFGKRASARDSERYSDNSPDLTTIKNL